MPEYKILRQITWIFKVTALNEREAMIAAGKTWDDDLRLSNKVLLHQDTDKLIEES